MKTLFNLLAIGLLFSVQASAQWVKQNSPVTNNLYDVAFFNSNFGYVVGASGTILKTTNGGNTWIQVTSPDNRDIISVTVIDSSTLIITTGFNKSKAFVYRSKDQGATWRKVLDDSRPFYATKTPANNLYSVSAQIYKSTDIGKNWSAQQPLNSTSSYSQVEFVNNNTGIVGGNISGFITYSADFLRTSDGQHWYNSYPFSFPNANGFSSLSTVTADSVYMFTNFYNRFTPGDSSQLILLTNFRLLGPAGSQEWVFDSKILVNSFQDRINDCKFFQDGRAYAVSDAGVIYSYSSAQQFKKEYSSKTGLHAIYMLNKENGYVVGNNGLILRKHTPTVTPSVNKNLSDLKKPISAVQ